MYNVNDVRLVGNKIFGSCVFDDEGWIKTANGNLTTTRQYTKYVLNNKGEFEVAEQYGISLDFECVDWDQKNNRSRYKKCKGHYKRYLGYNGRRNRKNSATISGSKLSEINY